MRQIRSRAAIAKWLIVLIIATVCTTGLAFGQAKVIAQFHVPYEFLLGSKMLPAGTYTFVVEGSWLVVKSPSGDSLRQSIITELSGPSELFREGSLVFDKTEKGPVLSEVWMPEMKGLLVHSTPKGHKHDLVWGSSLSPTQSVSGKTAFSLTCAKCHGPDGKGDTGADKFFKTTIPRLNTAAVQGLPDETLKSLIMQGDEIMPPVEIDEAGYRHRLPLQDVDAVIAYVRTLK